MHYRPTLDHEQTLAMYQSILRKTEPSTQTEPQLYAAHSIPSSTTTQIPFHTLPHLIISVQSIIFHRPSCTISIAHKLPDRPSTLTISAVPEIASLYPSTNGILALLSQNSLTCIRAASCTAKFKACRAKTIKVDPVEADGASVRNSAVDETRLKTTYFSGKRKIVS